MQAIGLLIMIMHVHAVRWAASAVRLHGAAVRSLCEPFQPTSVGIQSVCLQVDYRGSVRLRVPTLTLHIESVDVKAMFQMWPRSRQRRQKLLSANHQYQIAKLDKLLGRGTPCARWSMRTWLQHKLVVAATQALRQARVCLRGISVQVECTNTCQHWPHPDSFTSDPGLGSGSKALLFTVERAELGPSMRLPVASAVSTEACMQPKLLTGVSIAGVDVLCSEQSTFESAAHEAFLIRRWRLDAQCHTASSAPTCKARRAAANQADVVLTHIHAKALVAMADEVTLRTAAHFATALREFNRFARYRAYRPTAPVRQNIRAWWRHATSCVCCHLQEMKQDARLPASCLSKLSSFAHVYKPVKAMTQAGVRPTFACCDLFRTQSLPRNSCGWQDSRSHSSKYLCHTWHSLIASV